MYVILLCFAQNVLTLHYLKRTRAKLAKSKQSLEAEKAALDKQVRGLTFKLQVRAEDIAKKEVGMQNYISKMKYLPWKLHEWSQYCHLDILARFNV